MAPEIIMKKELLSLMMLMAGITINAQVPDVDSAAIIIKEKGGSATIARRLWTRVQKFLKETNEVTPRYGNCHLNYIIISSPPRWPRPCRHWAAGCAASDKRSGRYR